MLDAGGEDAIDLMSVVAVSHAPQYSPLFNRLKRSIFKALEHDKTDGAARERLSGAVVSAAFAVIRKEESFKLPRVDGGRALTRMPNSVRSEDGRDGKEVYRTVRSRWSAKK